MLKIQIKTAIETILFEYEKENNTILDTLEEAIKQEANLEGAYLYGAYLYGAYLYGANLYGANLTRANLEGANLYGANLEGANLYGANLTRANLEGANLYGANLYGANLYGANLTRANLEGANLYGANLYGANLEGANLTRANLTRANLEGANLTRANLEGANLTRANLEGANLEGANLDYFKNALWAILLKSQQEIPSLKKSIQEGKINGSVYEGDCCCLVGTIAKARNCHYQSLTGITPNSHNPAETWFLQFRRQQTPENYEPLKMTLEWIEEFEHYLHNNLTVGGANATAQK